MCAASKSKRYSQHVIRSARWKALRIQALRRDGFKCRECGASSRLEVDHIKPVRSHPELAFDLDNLQSLCARCHGAKTAREVGLPPLDPRKQAWRAAVKALQTPSNGKDEKCSPQ